MTVIINADDLGDWANLSISLDLKPDQIDLIIMCLTSYAGKRYLSSDQRVFLAEIVSQLKKVSAEHEKTFVGSHPKSLYVK